MRARPCPALPKGSGRLEVARRALLALLLTAVAFAIFPGAGGIDRLAGALTRARPVRGALWAMLARCCWPALAPDGRADASSGRAGHNHASWIDIVALQRATRAFFVSRKAEVAAGRIGQIGRAIGTEFIERRRSRPSRQTERLRMPGFGAAITSCRSREERRATASALLPSSPSLFAVFFAPDLPDTLGPAGDAALRSASRFAADFYGWWGEMDFGAHLMAVRRCRAAARSRSASTPAAATCCFPGPQTLAAAAETAVAAAFEPPALPVR